MRRRLLLPSAALLLLVLALPAFAAARTIHAASLASAPIAAPPRSIRLPAAPPLPLIEAVSPSVESAASAPSSWLDEINRYRLAAGLAPVTEQPAWEAGLQHHLTYMAKTPAQYYTGAYVSLHTENPASPYYTPDGALEAGRSDLISGGTTSEIDAVDRWLTAPFHAIGMLRARLGQVELGWDPATGAAGLDVIQGVDWNLPAATSPILFPGPGITTNLVQFGGESPDPLETLGWQQLPHVGLPLIALLLQAPDAGLTASLVRPNGPPETSANGDLGIVDENTYVSSDQVYGPTGLAILKGDHAVLLIPRQPLVNGAYSVRIQQPGQGDISWSFSVIVAPMLTDFSPTRGPVGTLVNLDGTGFSGVTEVRFGSTAARSYSVISDTQLTATVPAGATSGPISVTTPGGSASSSSAFTVSAPPLNTVLPALTGTAALGQTLACSTGTWTGTPAPTYTYQWQRGDRPIGGATAGTYVVTNADQGKTLSCLVAATNNAGSAKATSNSLAVPLPPPKLTKLSPTAGKRGATVTITGTGFGVTRGPGSVKFGAVTCSNYLSWSATRIICRVPAGAKTGKLKVTLSTAAGASSAVSFTVIASPRKLKFRVADAESRDWRHAP